MNGISYLLIVWCSLFLSYIPANLSIIFLFCKEKGKFFEGRYARTVWKHSFHVWLPCFHVQELCFHAWVLIGYNVVQNHKKKIATINMMLTVTIFSW